MSQFPKADIIKKALSLFNAGQLEKSLNDQRLKIYKIVKIKNLLNQYLLKIQGKFGIDFVSTLDLAE